MFAHSAAYSSAADGAAHHAFPHGAWNHVGVSWDGTDLQLYINGTASSSNTAASWLGGNAFAAPHPGNFVSDNVRYDDIRFFTRALSGTLIQAIYNEGTP